MNDRGLFDDPVLTRRVQDWVDEQRDARAPSRLVGAIMAEVEAAPRRPRPWSGAWARWNGFLAYAALATTIAIGVTIGIALGQSFGPTVGDSPPPSLASPSPPVSPTPGASPDTSPVSLVSLPDVPISATAVAAAANGVWVVDRDARLAELDPVSGAMVRSVVLPRPADDLLLTESDVWVASATGDLVRVDRATLSFTSIAGSAGAALAVSLGAIWVGGVDRVVRVDVSTSMVDLEVDIPGRGAELGIAASGEGLWVGTRTEILRLSIVDGGVTARIAGDASRLAVGGGWLWATRGTELLRIDPVEARIVTYLAGVPAASPMRWAAGLVWTAGPPGAAIGTIVAVDTATDRFGARSEVSSGVVALAIGTDTVWVPTDDGVIRRFRLP